MQQPYLQSFDENYVNKCHFWYDLYPNECYPWDIYFPRILIILKRKVLELPLGTGTLGITTLKKRYTQKVSGYVTERKISV